MDRNEALAVLWDGGVTGLEDVVALDDNRYEARFLLSLGDDLTPEHAATDRVAWMFERFSHPDYAPLVTAITAQRVGEPLNSHVWVEVRVSYHLFHRAPDRLSDEAFRR
jgi:hypothetical protein